LADDKKPSTLAGLLNKRPPAENPESAASREAFQEARPRSREDIMLDIRLADGRIVTFSYAYFARMDFTPGDTLSLRLPGAVVRVEGRRLARLREALAEHRARFIAVHSGGHGGGGGAQARGCGAYRQDCDRRERRGITK
jgi:hypothetical protein